MGAIEELVALDLQLPAPLAAPPGVRLPFELVRIPGDLGTSLVTALSAATACSHWRRRRRVATEEAYAAARARGLSILAATQELGELDRVTGWIKALGFVNCAEGSTSRQPRSTATRLDPGVVGRRRAPRPFSDRRR